MRKRAGAAEAEKNRAGPIHIGQSASEYMTILAAVLLIALFAIFILNSAGASSASQSPYKSYWSSLTPLSIADVVQTGASQVVVSVQNTDSRELTMTKFILATADGAHYFVNDSSITFTPGQKRLVAIRTDSSVANCDSYAGNYPNKYSVFIGYDLESVTGKSFNSTNRLLPALCLPAVASGGGGGRGASPS
ncbi:Uncharacterised protein [uncultured archaeon]|nr:Uncharacterised protein [uncultured archaeon]